MRKHVTTTIRLTEDLHERIKRVAREERRTTNNYISVALEEAVMRYEAEHPELREADAPKPADDPLDHEPRGSV